MEIKTLSIQEKDNKIFSHIRKIWLIKTPEEIVRQNYLLTLINEYGYSLDQKSKEKSKLHHPKWVNRGR